MMTSMTLNCLAFCVIILSLYGASFAWADGRYLDLDGLRIYYEECGAGPSIVLLHDGLVHSVVWDAGKITDFDIYGNGQVERCPRI